MRIRNVVSSLAVGAAFFAGVPLAAAGTQTAELLPPCATDPFRSETVHFEKPDQWSYDYYVLWCANSAQVEWTVPVVTHEIPDGSDCTWVGDRESQSPKDGGVSALGMSEFSCPNARVTVDNPWAIVGVSPDGSSRVEDKGIA